MKKSKFQTNVVFLGCFLITSLVAKVARSSAAPDVVLRELPKSIFKHCSDGSYTYTFNDCGTSISKLGKALYGICEKQDSSTHEAGKFLILRYFECAGDPNWQPIDLKSSLIKNWKEAGITQYGIDQRLKLEKKLDPELKKQLIDVRGDLQTRFPLHERASLPSSKSESH